MKFLLTDVEIGALSLVLIALGAFIGWKLLPSNVLRPLLPRWLRRRLHELGGSGRGELTLTSGWKRCGGIDETLELFNPFWRIL
jgi:hypothetical protein